MIQKQKTNIVRHLFIFTFATILLGSTFTAAAAGYWVQFGSPGKPASDWDTAEELLEKLSANGLQATEIDRWKNSGWDGHIKDFPFNDFDIKPEEGYFLKLTTNNPDFESILTDYESYIPSEYAINVSWNLVNFPNGFKDKYDIENAEDICKNIGDSITEVSYTEPMEEQLKPIDESPGYKAHTCGSSDNNFEIKEAHSYFLKGAKYSTWKPEKKEKTYFVFWGPKGIPADSWNKAEELLEKLNSEGISASEIDKWVNSGWEGHVKDYPFNDFSVEAGSGYIIAVSDPNANLNNKLDNWTDSSSMSYNLKASWNLISFPKALIEGNSDLTKASDLCDYEGITEVQFTKYFEKGTEPSYTNFECSDNDDDFSLESGIAYFVKSSKNTTLTISKTETPVNEEKKDEKDDSEDDKDAGNGNEIDDKGETDSVIDNKPIYKANPLQTITTPLGQVLGKDFTNLSYYDSLLILLLLIILLLLVLLIVILIVYKARKKDALPSIRMYIKTKLERLFKKPANHQSIDDTEK